MHMVEVFEKLVAVVAAVDKQPSAFTHTKNPPETVDEA